MGVGGEKLQIHRPCIFLYCCFKSYGLLLVSTEGILSVYFCQSLTHVYQTDGRTITIIETYLGPVYIMDHEVGPWKMAFSHGMA
jgi:hypothetical protein